MDLKQYILWIDGLPANIVGVGLLIFHPWLEKLYLMPIEVIIFLGFANLLYGLYSLSLACYLKRTLFRVNTLVIGNLIWSSICLLILLYFFHDSSLLAKVFISCEAVFFVYWLYLNGAGEQSL